MARTEAPRRVPAKAPAPSHPAPETAPRSVLEASLDEYVPGAKVLDLDEARNYLVKTVDEPGGTMQRQGVRLAIERLHPAFAVRLAAAVREARDEGILAFVFSAYRPPEYGVGGYRNKFDSAHTYGLAADMGGIGEPCSKDAKEWHRIVARHGLFLPYGPCNRSEWNHTQLMGETGREFVGEHPRMRHAVKADGPVSALAMWVYSGIKRVVGVAEAAVAVEPKITDERHRHYAAHHEHHRRYAHHHYRHYARA
jgi:hypothetical protein